MNDWFILDYITSQHNCMKINLLNWSKMSVCLKHLSSGFSCSWAFSFFLLVIPSSLQHLETSCIWHTPEKMMMKKMRTLTEPSSLPDKVVLHGDSNSSVFSLLWKIVNLWSLYRFLVTSALLDFWSNYISRINSFLWTNDVKMYFAFMLTL